jgi:hypothetical protein
LGRKRNVLLCDHEPRRHKSRNDCSKNKHTADCTVRSGSQVGESSLPECRGTDQCSPALGFTPSPGGRKHRG